MFGVPPISYLSGEKVETDRVDDLRRSGKIAVSLELMGLWEGELNLNSDNQS